MALSSTKLKFGVVILGAGKSSRMGRPKLLLPWKGTSVVGHLALQWNRAGAGQVAIVCESKDTALREELDRLAFPEASRIYNPEPERGMFSSIRCAAAWPKWPTKLTHFIIVLGDQPHLHEETLARLVDFGAANPGSTCQPSRRGRARHPVLLPGKNFRELANWPGENLKQFLLGQDVKLCEMDDPGLDVDMDTPADYQEALKMAGCIRFNSPDKGSISQF
jgi:molybdenum cofactor cytidylyltransferase